jgi:EF hand
MLRRIYSALLRLHPAGFRNRFGSGMLSIYDHASARPRLLVDGALSLVRQWLMRSEFRLQAAPARESLEGCPRFLTFDEQPALGPQRRITGLALSLLSFMAIGFVLSSSGNHSVVVVGSRSSSKFGLPIESQSSRRSLDTEVTLELLGILDSLAGRARVREFYRSIPVLSALDIDHDLIISPEEIADARAVLLSLDRDGDGTLDVTECAQPRAHRQYKQLIGEGDVMRSNPVLLALNTNRDGTISTSEIRGAPVTLKLLDKDHDGRLTPEEVLSAGQVKLLKEIPQ